MEVALSRLLLHHARLLQQVVGDDASDGIRLVVELNVHVLAKATGVVVAICLGIAECLQDCIALDEHVLDSGKVWEILKGLVFSLLYFFVYINN